MKRGMGSPDGRSTEGTERPYQTITELRLIENLVFISLEFLNANCSRSLDANVNKILALNEQILCP